MAKSKTNKTSAKQPIDRSNNNKFLRFAIYTLVLIIILAIVGANSFNLNTTSELFDVKASDLFTDNFAKIHVKTLHIDNNYFLPRSYVMPAYGACLFNSESKKSTSLNLMFDDKDYYNLEAIEIGAYAKKDVNFYVNNLLPRKSTTPYPVAEKLVIDVNQPLQEVDIDYDSILLIMADTNRNQYQYVDCYSLTSEQIEMAERVKIV